MWHLTNGGEKHSLKISAPQQIWDRQCLEDSKLKDHSMNELLNDKGVYRTAPAIFQVGFKNYKKFKDRWQATGDMRLVTCNGWQVVFGVNCLALDIALCILTFNLAKHNILPSLAASSSRTFLPPWKCRQITDRHVVNGDVLHTHTYKFPE